jgi:hypothetical protein
MWRTAVVVLLTAPGAVYGGVMGGLVGSFAGDASPPPMVFTAIVAGCVAVGALLGSLPGIIVGVLLQVRWVLPLLGAAFGAVLAVAFCVVVGQLTGVEIATPQRAGLAAFIFLAPPLLGLLFGVRRYQTLRKRDQLRASPTTEPE